MILATVDLVIDRFVASQTGLRENPPRPAPVWMSRAASLPWITGSVAASALLIALAGLAPDLQWTRGAGGMRTFWQLLTCHLTHWSADHLIWDLAALLILGTLCERRWRGATAACLLLSSACIAAGVDLLQPDLAFYRGLSGLDSALLGLLITRWLQESVSRGGRCAAALPLTIAALFILKLTIELTTGSAVFVQTPDMVPVPLAHAIGLACGILIAAVMRNPLSLTAGHTQPSDDPEPRKSSPGDCPPRGLFSSQAHQGLSHGRSRGTGPARHRPRPLRG